MSIYLLLWVHVRRVNLSVRHIRHQLATLGVSHTGDTGLLESEPPGSGEGRVVRKVRKVSPRESRTVVFLHKVPRSLGR